ncbi:hypothetical protein OEZ86_008057 [Tetradesmus obliquus]|nr:hypothetical protein OEZ86_008057 [Tetradesmus obliquus]
MLILTLWLALLLRGSCEAVRQDEWHSSSTNFSFKDELTDAAISTIVVPGNYSVAAEFENHQAPIQLTRNVTLTGAQGLDTVLDLAFLHGVVQLCATCVFTMTNITLTNDRRGGYGLIDFFLGQPSGSSILRLHDTPRSKHVAGADKPQLTGVGNVTWNGRTWLNVLMNEDYTVDVTFAMEEGGHHEGRYAVDGKRTRSLCEHTVSAACLANKEPQVCIEEIIDETLAARRAAANNGRPHPAAIVVPAIGAVLLVWASVAFVLCTVQFGELLGAGSFGRVYRGRWNGMEVAVKVIEHDASRAVEVENEAIHSRNIVHGDLNARNVLVRSNAAAAAGLTAKLADFGLSRAMKQHQTHRTTKTWGTMSHMPPEVLKEGRMSPAMDVYAFGVMMWEAATGKTAFKELHYGSFYQAIVLQGLRPAMPAGMLQDSAALMRQCRFCKVAGDTCLRITSLVRMITVSA